jgi:hypothetical protein
MAGQFKLELDSMLARADNLMIRLDGASTLVGSGGTAFEIRANFQKVSSILNYHATKATQASNDKAGKMAELAKSDNSLMLKMTKKSVADARTLKTITILTLVYLPASFVSVSCPMGTLNGSN